MNSSSNETDISTILDESEYLKTEISINDELKNELKNLHRKNEEI
jgi:hypothetical protein